MKDLREIINELIQFRDERDWAQFHNPKDLAIALNIEASELLELYLWKSSEEANVDQVKEELADVLLFALLISENYHFDINRILQDKIEINKKKYPVDKTRGSAKKYNEL